MTQDEGGWFVGRRVMVTGGMGFIGSHLAERLVELGAQVTIVDSLIPDYGGNEFNIRRFEEQVRVSITDIRDRYCMAHLLRARSACSTSQGRSATSTR